MSESRSAQGEQPLVRQVDEVQPLVRPVSGEQREAPRAAEQQEAPRTEEREESRHQEEARREEGEQGEDKGLLRKIKDKLTGE